MKRSTAALAACLAWAAAAGCSSAATAQDAPSLAGKTVQLIIGFGTGGGYDVWGRIVARFIGRHLPGNPTVVPQNKPGAGSYTAAAYLYNVAPNDGTVFGLIGRDAPLGPVTGAVGARFRPREDVLARDAHDRNERLHRGEDGEGQNRPGPVQQRVDRRRRRPGQRYAILSAGAQRASRNEIQADLRFSLFRGRVPRHGTRRSRGSARAWTASRTDNRRGYQAATSTSCFRAASAPDPDVKAPFIPDLAKTQHDKDAIAFLYVGQGIGRPFVAPPGMAPIG